MSDGPTLDRDRIIASTRVAIGYALFLALICAVVVGVAYIVLRRVPESRLGTYLSDAGNALVSRPNALSAFGQVTVVGIVVLAVAGLVFLLWGRRQPGRARGTRVSARFRLALSYAVFLVAAGAVSLFGVYVVLRYIPDYPLTAANPKYANAPVASRDDILNAVIGVSAVILAALAVLGITGGWILAGWVLRPLQRINEAAQIAAGGRLDHRIKLRGRNDEFRQLADSFDHMLDRIDNAFATQERFAANASHELRTPLTVMETLLDVARRHPEEQDYAILVDRLSVTNARAIGLTEALLRLADANAITAVSKPVDLSAIVREAITENTDEADQQSVTITAELDSAPMIGDATLLAQLASNLIQNAIRHNVADGIVMVTTSRDLPKSAVQVRIENTGTVYTPEVAAQLIEPFLRGSGRISSNRSRAGAKGYGLGLALVARIVEVHDGSLTVVPRDGGGLIVSIALPLAANDLPGR
ncbi:HAMP domain-containing sensor histidine kinase [soil metagenome]